MLLGEVCYSLRTQGIVLVKATVCIHAGVYNTHRDIRGFTCDITNTYSAAFAEADVFFSNNFAAKFGVRASHTGVFDVYSIAPRLSLAYKLNKQAQLSFAFGNFYQAPQNDELKFNQDLDLQMASHYILNYQYKKNNQLFRAEAFYKKYDKLLRYESDMNQQLSNFKTDGFGDAKGLDLFWKDTRNIKNLQ